MEKDFCLGMVVGLLGGTLLAANSLKVRKTVKDGQTQIMNALEKWNDESKEYAKEKNTEKSDEKTAE